MIAYKHRFHGHNSLRFVYAHGKTIRSGLFSVRFAPNPKRTTYRCAVVVSKKISKSAVVRNRIRRRLYEATRLQQAGFSEPYDIVITVFNESVADMPSQELQASLGELLESAKITPANR